MTKTTEALKVVAYLRATKDEKPVWSEDCVCENPVYPSDPDGSDEDCISMPVVRLSEATERLAALQAEALAKVAEMEKKECEHCGGTGEVFAHAKDCTDDLCALNGDQHSCGGRVEPCACTQAPTADIPPGCEMARGWCVEVSAGGERVLLLSDVGYSGLADLEPWASTIRGCAEHLLSFIGPADGGAPFMESLDTSEGDAREPHPCAHGCRYALNGEGLAPRCIVGCRRVMKEGIKK